MDQLRKIVLDVEFLKWAVPLIGGIIAWFVNEGLKRREQRWELKRQACLKALEIVDAHFSHQSWSGAPIQAESQQKPDVASARDVYNKLCLSCKNGEVLREYKKCLGLLGKFDAGDIVDLRNAIRKELGFGGHFDVDRKRAWIARLNKPENKS